MKKLTLAFLTAFASLFLFSACAPVYKCGDPIPDKKPGGKRLKAVVEERDDLCTKLDIEMKLNAENRMVISDQNSEIDRFKKDLGNLEQRYNDLLNENVSQSDRFSAALRQKSEELKEQERLLADREKTLREMQAIIARQDSLTRRLNDIVRNALLGFNSDELTVEVRNGKVYVSMSNKLLFRSGSAAVETKGQEALRVLADVLNQNPDIDVMVEGHTDNVPIRTAQFRDNWDLSVIRATSIVRILTEDLQISPLRITASGKGEFMPRAANDTAEGKALNRRTEIILSPKLDELMQLLEGN